MIIFNNNIIDIEDKDGNGKYDVKDFLELKNEELLSMNNGKRFDVVLQNPPYSTSGDALHLQFVDKLLDIAESQVVIMPFSFVTKQGIKNQDKFKDKFDSHIDTIEEVQSSLFLGTAMGNVAIYKIDNKKLKDSIKITYLDGNINTVSSLKDIDKFSIYENEFVAYFKKYNRIDVMNLGYFLPIKHLADKGIKDQDEIDKQKEINAKYCIRNIPDNKAYLICNSVNGGMNGMFFSTRNGQIIDSKEKLKNYIKSIDNVSNGYNCAILNSILSAKNCKIAMMHPLMRFLLYKLQQDQRMTPNKCYKYIPNIDWEDDRVLTDEGLLEVCGCPKDKAKEYAEYCKKYIEENVDKK